MPIRFRCKHCSQLMGIARRKAGTAVHCIRCGQSVVVPQEDQVDVPRPAASVPIAPTPASGSEKRSAQNSELSLLDRPNLVDQLDQDDNFPGPDLPSSHAEPELSILGARQPPPIPVPGVPGVPVEYDVEPVDPEQIHPSGYVLSSTQATTLTLGVIVAVVLAFGAGLLIGKYYL